MILEACVFDRVNAQGSFRLGLREERPLHLNGRNCRGLPGINTYEYRETVGATRLPDIESSVGKSSKKHHGDWAGKCWMRCKCSINLAPTLATHRCTLKARN